MSESEIGQPNGRVGLIYCVMALFEVNVTLIMALHDDCFAE